MIIKKGKVSDGFFELERSVVSADDRSRKAAKTVGDIFDNARNIEWHLDDVEKRINNLLKASQERIVGRSPRLKAHTKKYEELNQVLSYAKRALRYLNNARQNLKKHDAGQAMIDAILMMDAYWRGFIHTRGIKHHILRGIVEGRGRSEGGLSRAEKYKQCRENVRELAAEIWKERNFSKRSMCRHLLKNYEQECTLEIENQKISESSIRRYIEDLSPHK